MQDRPFPLDAKLDGLSWTDWRDAVYTMVDEDGFAENLGDHHCAVFVEKKPTLLVSFEAFDTIKDMSPDAHPMGWQLAEALSWSHLAVVCDHDTWFRDRYVYGFFDRLIDDGFFEDFEQVIFFGAGPCGYAACAFSVAAPGARVLALQPQATLDPRVTEWDERFLEMRRTDFTSRFGYAPDMLDAAKHAWVVYDPQQPMDAAHAALFTRDNVTKVRARYMGPKLQKSLSRKQILMRMLAQISAGKLTTLSIAKMMRDRRQSPIFQHNLLQALEAKSRYRFGKILCEEVLKQRQAPFYRKAFNRFKAALEEA